MPTADGSDSGSPTRVTLEVELAAMRTQVAVLNSENARLLRLLELTPQQARFPGAVQTGIFDVSPGSVHAGSSAATKVSFFSTLFGARSDVYAVRWENSRSGKAGWMPAVRGGWRRGMPASQRQYLPLTEEVLTAHLSGELDVGLYPLLEGDRCRWLAADFDGPAAKQESRAVICQQRKTRRRTAVSGVERIPLAKRPVTEDRLSQPIWTRLRPHGRTIPNAWQLSYCVRRARRNICRNGHWPPSRECRNRPSRGLRADTCSRHSRCSTGSLAPLACSREQPWSRSTMP